MESFDHLPRAPITEAILDVQVRARSDFEASAFKALQAELNEEFPRLTERRHFVARFEIAGGVHSREDKELGLDGYVFWSADGLDAVQFRVDGFALNRLKPYPGWNSWFPRFVRLWDLYCKIAKPSAVARVGSRCINQVPIEGSKSLDDYLAAPPAIAKGLPDNLKAFLSRIELSDGGQPEMLLNLVQGLQIGPDGQSPQVLLDIDAFCVGDFALTEVVPLLERLHVSRNSAFFRSLTPTAIQRFL